MLDPQLGTLTFGYPGAMPYWELLWLQNVVLIFVQFATGAALFSQDTRYSSYLTAVIPRRDNRTLLLTIHAAAGVLVVLVNVVFAYRWFAAQNMAVTQLLSVHGYTAWTTLLLTIGILVMGITGGSLYVSVRPDTIVPFWSFEYALSRKLHRGAFVLVVLLLGHHIYFDPRIYLVWESWIANAELFGVIVLGTFALWGILAAQSLLMAAEWVTGRFFSKWIVDASGIVSIAGMVVALAFALVRTFTSLSSIQLVAGVTVLCLGAIAVTTIHSRS